MDVPKAIGSGRVAAMTIRANAELRPPAAAETSSVEPTRMLADIGEDLLLSILHRVSSPLDPRTAVGLARGCCKSLRSMQLLRRASVGQLRSQHKAALTLCKKTGLTLDRLEKACRLSWGRKELTAQDAQLLVQLSRHLSRLEEIDLSNNDLGDAGLLALTNASVAGAFPALRVLAMPHNGISDRGARALATAAAACPSPAFLCLEQLMLQFNRIAAEGMADLAIAIGGGAFPKLGCFFLAGNPAEDAIVQQALTFPSAARSAAGGGGYLGGTQMDSPFTCCRDARRAGRGGRFF